LFADAVQFFLGDGKHLAQSIYRGQSMSNAMIGTLWLLGAFITQYHFHTNIKAKSKPTSAGEIKN
jgi:hypothetical protein